MRARKTLNLVILKMETICSYETSFLLLEPHGVTYKKTTNKKQTNRQINWVGTIPTERPRMVGEF
jgi:hypothetical protein